MTADDVIAEMVKAWLSSPSSPMPWLAPEAERVRALAREHRAVPLYLGWTAVFARESGEVSLGAALPPRPDDAVTCDVCTGTGRIREPFICKCGGYGWVLPGEQQGDGSADAPALEPSDPRFAVRKRETPASALGEDGRLLDGGADGTRTRGLRRDRPAL